VLAGVPERVRPQLEQGKVRATEGRVRFEPDLDRGLEWCEDHLLGGGAAGEPRDTPIPAPNGLPLGVARLLERMTLPEGALLIHQGEAPDDLFVLESGRLSVEVTTEEGTRMRVRSLSPGVVVGEIGLYLGGPRTADVVAETPSVVLRLTRATIQQLEETEPEVASDLHRWLATTLADRLSDAMRAADALLD
jgi:SulP family sulfate permease